MQNNNHKLVYALVALLLAAPAMAASVRHARPHHPAFQKTAAIRAPHFCTSVAVDPTSYVTLGKSSVIPLSAPAVRVFTSSKTDVFSSKKGGAGNRMTLFAGSKTKVIAATKTGVIAGSKTNVVAVQSSPDSKPAPPTPGATKSEEGVGDVSITLLSPKQLFFLGKKTGTMNIVLQSADGRCFVRDIVVAIDPSVLQDKLTQLMPDETGLRVVAAGNSLVLTGTVSDAVKLDEAMTLATAYANDKKIINLLRLRAPQEVMLEVKIAEVSKTLLDKLNIDFARLLTAPGSGTSRIISGIIGGGPATFGQFHNGIGGALVNGIGGGAVGAPPGAAVGTLTASGSGATLLGVDAQKQDGLVRVLAEPNLTAISGQSASFLSGGKIFIPVSQTNNNGAPTITLEEKKFGVGLTFTPTVLQDGHINLKLTTEASELSQTGSPFTTVGGVTAVLPSLTTRQADTTVELKDGQSFAIAGLIRNNITESIHRFPGLGDMPVLGALFRSTEFQKDQTELIFVVTPHLVKPTNDKIVLPTDMHKAPSVADALLLGKTEGTAPVAPTGQAGASPISAAPAGKTK